MNSSLFWCIVGIIGGAIISLLISSFFYFIGKKRTCLTYNIMTFCLISNKSIKIKGLEIKYNSQEIENLYSSTITIKNTGNSIIEKKDFVHSFPLSVSTDGYFIIDDSYNENFIFINNTSVTNNDEINKIVIDIDYIPKREIQTFTFIHTENIFFSGKLKDGKIIQIFDKSKYEEKYGVIIDFTVNFIRIFMVILSIYNFFIGNILYGVLILCLDLFPIICEKIIVKNFKI